MKKLVLSLFGLLLLAACANQSPSPAARPTLAPAAAPSATATAEPTAAPTLMATPTAAVALFQPVAELLQAYQPGESDPAPLYNALAQATIQFLTGSADPNSSLEGQPALDALKAALVKLKLPEGVTPDLAAIHIRDSEGGSADILLLSLTKMMGLPVIAIHRLGSSYQALSLDGSDPADPGARNLYAGTVAGVDVTGDGVGEAVYTYDTTGASGDTELLHIARWDEDAQKFRTLFQAMLITWAGESRYEFIPGDKGQNLKLTYPWFGVFDHKLAAHPEGTQIWTYDKEKDLLVMQSETVEPAKTVRQQLNVAEDLFRRGEFEQAIPEYERAWKDTTLTGEQGIGNTLATRAFARFREGQLLALLGQTGPARAALEDASKSGGTVGQLAAVFLMNDTGPDAVVRAWAALSAIDVDEIIYKGNGQADIDFPARGSDILFKGEIVAAYLDAHPDAGAQAFAQLRALGLEPLSSAVTDLDGDGKLEYLMVTQEGGASPNQMQDLWLIYRGPSHWLARELRQETTLTLDASPVPLPDGKGSAVKLVLPATVQSPDTVLTWDRTRVIYLDPQTLQPRGNTPLWPVLGGMGSTIQF